MQNTAACCGGLAQSDDVGGFRFEIRIVAGQVTLDPMRLQARFFPHPVHHIFADTQMGRELTNASASIHRLAFSGQRPESARARGPSERSAARNTYPAGSERD
ncbi:MAG: hypothetical protein WB992_09595 [Bryobacteraceae bacterium]